MKAMKLQRYFITVFRYKPFGSNIGNGLGRSFRSFKNHFYQKIIGYDKEGYFAIQSQGILGVNDETLTLEYFFNYEYKGIKQPCINADG